jgi:hypothetical protein
MTISHKVNNVILTIARMNPPTLGHVFLIENMIKSAIHNNTTEIIILLSASVDTIKNPIICKDKQKILYTYGLNKERENVIEEMPQHIEFIENINFDVICMDDIKYKSGNTVIKDNIFTILRSMFKQKYNYPEIGLKLSLVIGEDRKGNYDSIEKYVSNEINPIIFEEPLVLTRPDGSESATKIRQLAQDDKEKFMDYYMDNFNMPKNEVVLLHNEIIKNTKVIGIKRSRQSKVSIKKTRKGGKTKKQIHNSKRNKYIILKETNT